MPRVSRVLMMPEVMPELINHLRRQLFTDTTAGNYCPAGSLTFSGCPAGYCCPASASTFLGCTAGQYSGADTSACSMCPAAGYFCASAEATRPFPRALRGHTPRKGPQSAPTATRGQQRGKRRAHHASCAPRGPFPWPSRPADVVQRGDLRQQRLKRVRHVQRGDERGEWGSGLRGLLLSTSTAPRRATALPARERNGVPGRSCHTMRRA